MTTFAEFDYVRLTKPLPTLDGVIPAGTEGTVLLIYGNGVAYCVEFEGDLWKVPETVPRDALVAVPTRDEATDAVSAEQIIQAATDPPAASLLVTDDTPDEELSAFIRGKRRGQHR